MSEKYKTTFRGYLIDNHSPDPPAVTLEKLNPEEFEQFFLEADLNECMIYCKDHWGNSYYDTKIGKIHGGLKQDWIQQLIPVLKNTISSLPLITALNTILMHRRLIRNGPW